ncbi:hypothetical protein Hanom_Chr02g00112121 [Helianthus anomalus]
MRLLTSTARNQNVIPRDLLVATRDRAYSSRDPIVSTGLPTGLLGHNVFNWAICLTGLCAAEILYDCVNIRAGPITQCMFVCVLCVFIACVNT